MAKYDEYIHHPSRWPTKRELHEVIAPMTADTILQILRGQGLYFGYECERHCDNEIRNYPFLEREDTDLIALRQDRYNAKVEARRHRIETVRLANKAIKERNAFRKKYRKVILCVAMQFGLNLDEAETRFRRILGQP